MKKFFLGLGMLFALNTVCVADSLDQAVVALASEQDLSGIVLVSAKGQPLVKRAFNTEALEGEFTIEPDSRFRVASLTKSLTAPLVLKQVEAGTLDLDAPISEYLPDFDATYADEVSLRQLLQNRSGIPHYTDIPGWFDPEVKEAFTPESFLGVIGELELRFEPSSDYYYSNVNYYLLGLILESITGSNYESLLREQLLDPLGMSATGQIYSPEADPIAPTYLRTDNQYQRIDLSNTWLFKATASAYSTASDLTLFGQKVMSGELLSEAMMSVLLDEQNPMGFTLAAVPLGESTTPVITYNGELAGTTSMLTMFPEYEGVIVILANNNTPYNTLVEMTIQIAEQAFSQ